MVKRFMGSPLDTVSCMACLSKAGLQDRRIHSFAKSESGQDLRRRLPPSSLRQLPTADALFEQHLVLQRVECKVGVGRCTQDLARMGLREGRRVDSDGRASAGAASASPEIDRTRELRSADFPPELVFFVSTNRGATLGEPRESLRDPTLRQGVPPSLDFHAPTFA
jgi:hypothetical protein